MRQELELRPLGPDLESSLTDLFQAFQEMRDKVYFAPHPFTSQQAQAIAQYDGRDFYALALRRGTALGYGLLRGWDEGYEVPSLGLAVHPGFRGIGLGRLLMDYLHTVAALRGSRQVRLRVHKENRRARSLYEKLGYEFQEHSSDFLVGFLALGRVSPSVAA